MIRKPTPLYGTCFLAAGATDQSFTLNYELPPRNMEPLKDALRECIQGYRNTNSKVFIDTNIVDSASFRASCMKVTFQGKQGTPLNSAIIKDFSYHLAARNLIPSAERLRLDQQMSRGKSSGQTI